MKRLAPPIERARAAADLARAGRAPKRCTALTGACNCQWCTDAAADTESPPTLTDGRWVNRRGVQVWQPRKDTAAA